jgi:glycosyltransferase involved in cell wall biosynthesis
MTNPPQLLIISHDTVGRRMAGPGIRAWETARALAARQPVTLVAPQPVDLAGDGFALGGYAWGVAGALEPWLRAADVVLANGFVLQAHPELALAAQPLALDLYDPVLLEDLEASRAAPQEERAARSALMRALLGQQLAAGDFFVCATERQRDLYIGALMAAGRLTPERVDADPRLRDLIDVAPFGLPGLPPARHAPGLRGVLPGVGADDLVLLWTGGLWDWLDPLTLLEALPGVAARHPRVRLVFLAGRHPGMVAPMRLPERARRRAEELGLLGRHVFFYEEWVPYERRADMLLDADLAVTLHRDHLETAYAAVRSRFLDHLWAGLPSLVTAGDAAAELVERHRLGRVAAAEDHESVARAMLELLDEPQERRACGERAQALAAAYTWERAAAPLERFCLAPRRTRPDRAAPGAGPARLRAERRVGEQTWERERSLEQYTRFKDAVARLHELWRIAPHEPGSRLPLVGRAKSLANTLIRWYIQPVVEQQNAFNAATVNAVQSLADTVERLAGEHAPLRQHVADIEQHLLDIDDAQTAMARRMADDGR